MATAPLGALALYAGLNALILIWLAVQTGRIRQSEKVFMGDGGNPRLIRVMRGHANAIEFMPVTLLLMLLIALLGAPAYAIHGLGLSLTVGRFLHALHFTAADAPAWQRGIGTGLSALAMLGAALWAVAAGLVSAV